MGVSTNLYICTYETDHKSKQAVLKRVLDGVQKFCQTEINNYIKNNPSFQNPLQVVHHSKDNPYSLYVAAETKDFELFTIEFGCGESRLLHCHTNCDVDFNLYAQTTGHGGVILSLGCWGRSDEIMRLIADHLEALKYETVREVWYLPNDSRDDEFEQLV